MTVREAVDGTVHRRPPVIGTRVPVAHAQADPLVWAYVLANVPDLRHVSVEPDGSAIVYNWRVR